MTEAPCEASSDRSPVDDLLTVRDWLRYATSRFNAAGLTYGHGTSTSLDEASFLILHTLDLPIDQLDPWLDARLTVPERRDVLAIIERRIETRKPAPYLTGVAYIQGHPFRVDERVIVPRSYFGELLSDGLSGVIPDPEAVARALDLCTGSGCLAILMALSFPNALVDAVDLSPDALALARENITDYGMEQRIQLLEGDLFEPAGEARYDLIISNPPYVSAETMGRFPPEHRAEPEMAHAGGDDGLDIVRRILAEAGSHLTEEGMLLVEVGTGRGILEAEYPDLPFLWLDTADSEGEVFALPASALVG